MDISWSTVFSSVGASVSACGILVWLCREWISARLQKSIQHEYDVKLEDFKSRIHYEYELKLESSKTDFQKVLDEHQTWFKYWYEEKAVSIKNFYTSLSKLYRELYESQVVIETYNAEQKEEILHYFTDKRKLIVNLEDESFRDWLRLRLYLEEEENSIVEKLFGKTNFFINKLIQNGIEQQLQTEKEKNKMLLKEITHIMESLRKQFRASLMRQDCNLGAQIGASSPQTPVDTSSKKDEAK